MDGLGDWLVCWLMGWLANWCVDWLIGSVLFNPLVDCLIDWLIDWLVWFGLVWFGLVWFGLVWFGLVWFGLVWLLLIGLLLKFCTIRFFLLPHKRRYGDEAFLLWDNFGKERMLIKGCWTLDYEWFEQFILFQNRCLESISLSFAKCYSVSRNKSIQSNSIRLL